MAQQQLDEGLQSKESPKYNHPLSTLQRGKSNIPLFLFPLTNRAGVSSLTESASCSVEQISNWIATEIVKDSKPEIRVKLIEKFINIAKVIRCSPFRSAFLTHIMGGPSFNSTA